MSEIETTELLNLQLGDILEIIAPSDPAMDRHTFYISFLDRTKIMLVESTGVTQTLTINEEGKLDNESVLEINILSRAESASYAIQNDLLPGKWVDIYFGGDVPTIITGEITNLEEDMIELTTYPEGIVIFIDFAYKGIPEDIPIIKITLRKKPGTLAEASVADASVAASVAEPSLAEPSLAEPSVAEASVAPTKRAPITSLDNLFDEDEPEPEPAGTLSTAKVEAQIRTSFINADQLQFGAELDEITQVVDLPETAQRYSLEKQTADLLDEMLASVPNIKRTDTVLNSIHTMIERFKQLRKTFSDFDQYGGLVKAKIIGSNYKPLIETLRHFNQKLYWLLPVVKNIKNLYTNEDDNMVETEREDINLKSFEETGEEEANIVKQYKAGAFPEQDNKYAYLLKKLNPFLTPFENGDSDAPALARLRVHTSIAAVVDSLGDLYSSVMETKKTEIDIKNKRFALQEYNVGISGLEIKKFQGGDTVTRRKALTENDTLVLKSLLLLPEATVRFARINLPYTNIMLKANLNEHFLNYWQLLHDATKVNTTVITNFETPIDYETAGFLQQVQEVTVDEQLLATNDAYSKFLEMVVPRTRVLLNLIKPYINDTLSLHEVIAYLEPFMIYKEDITFLQYEEINAYIAKRIVEHKKNYLIKVREYNAIKTGINAFQPNLVSLFDTNHALKESVLVAYGLTEANLTHLTSDEFLMRINSVDCGRVYNNAMALLGSSLMIANGLRDITDLEKKMKQDQSIQSDSIQGVSQGQSVSQDQRISEAQSQCKTYTTIAKRYIELDELQAENGEDIYFDKKYDTTHYDLLAEYPKPDPAMTNDAYIGFLINNLMKKIGLTELVARREAQAMLAGKRLVEDGDYAILENTTAGTGAGPSLALEYYRRQNKVWTRDETISTDVFDDKLKMICNLNEKCLEVKGKCEATADGLTALNATNLKLVLKEFDEHLNVNKAVVAKHINDDLQDALKRITILLDLSHEQKYRNNYKQYNLGLTIEEVDVVRSPYIPLRDKILGQADYVKRQQDLMKFVHHFARVPLPNEQAYWLYCVKTNTPLLPTFLHTLAAAFVMQKDIVYTIEKICKDQGKLSADGDAWVDEHSGYIIRKIALNVEEDFTEEGYKNITRSVLEADVGESILQLKKAQQTYTDPETEKIASIIAVMSQFMGINMDAYKEFIIRNVRKLQDSKMPTEEAYNKMLEKAAAQGKKNQDTYQTAYNQFFIFSTLAYFFIAIQVAVPSIQTRKTHPTCIRSFAGFPMGGAEDMTGITYLACIVHKIKSPIDHWKSLQKMTASTIAKRIETQISKFMLATEEVQDLIKTKQTYLLLNTDETIPDEHNIANMIHFLPPLIPIKMVTIQNISEAFQKELLEALRKGAKNQDQMLNIMRGKIIKFAFGINELIQKTVHKKAAILTNNAGEPFLENACCESTGKMGTLAYFIEAQPDIATYNDRIRELAHTLHDVIRMGKAGVYFDPRDTKNILPPLPKEFAEETIYKAFIVFCKYGSNLPISEELKAICMHKPASFNEKNTLAEHIRKLKGEGRNYSLDTFNQLLMIVNKQNIIKPAQRRSVKVTTVNALKDLLASLEQRNVTNIPVAFTEKLRRVLETFEINGLTEDTADMRTLQNYLAAANDAMVASITSFVRQSLAVKEEDYKFFKTCLETISDFQETGDNLIIERPDETVFKMMNFMNNSLRCLTREFPNIIINQVENAKVVIPKHWDLSSKHVSDIQDIIEKHYVSLNEFYKDADVVTILQRYMRLTRDTEILAKLTEFYAPLKIGEEKYIYSTMERRLVVRLFKFYFYSTLTDLMSLTTDDEVLIQRKPKSADDFDESALTSTESAFAVQNGEISEVDIISGEQKDVADKIAKLLTAFMAIICNDKKAVNYNYKSMMDKVLRAKEKEKDDMTAYLKNIPKDERDVDNVMKEHKLERWSKGLQKGLVSYQKDTYEEERATLEKQMMMDMRLSKNKDVTDMNRDIYAMELLDAEQEAAEIEEEDMRINYMGEDADFEEMGLDGDEEFD